MTNYPMLDDKLATLRNAIEGGVKADSMQGMKLMELVDATGEQFKSELADASAPEVDAGARPVGMDLARTMWAIRNKDREIGEEGIHQHLRDAFDDGFRAALSARASEAVTGEPVGEVKQKGSHVWLEINGVNLSSLVGAKLNFTAPPAASGQKLTDAARDVLDERKRQVTTEGCLPEVDDTHDGGQMALVAGNYALACAYPHERDLGRGQIPPYWPWAPSWWKPTTKRRNLVKAGALILAEIERLDRAADSATASDKEVARTYTTQPGESVMGIAHRQCGDEKRWRHILACNPEFADLLPHEYFPVGTVLTLPSDKEGA